MADEEKYSRLGELLDDYNNKLVDLSEDQELIIENQRNIALEAIQEFEDMGASYELLVKQVNAYFDTLKENIEETAEDTKLEEFFKKNSDAIGAFFDIVQVGFSAMREISDEALKPTG